MIYEFKNIDGSMVYKRRKLYYAGFGCVTKEDCQRTIEKGWIQDKQGYGFTLYEDVHQGEINQMMQQIERLKHSPEYYADYIEVIWRDSPNMVRDLSNLPCPTCMKQVIMGQTLIQQIYVSMSESSDTWICTECGEKFPYAHYEEFCKRFVLPGNLQAEYLECYNAIFKPHCHNDYISEEIAALDKKYDPLFAEIKEVQEGRMKKLTDHRLDYK